MSLADIGLEWLALGALRFYINPWQLFKWVGGLAVIMSMAHSPFFKEQNQRHGDAHKLHDVGKCFKRKILNKINITGVSLAICIQL